MPWFYNSHTGEAENISGIADVSLPLYEALLHTGTGWHEYSTQAQMQAAISANHWPAANQGIQLGKIPAETGGVAGAAASGAIKDTFSLNASGLAGWFFRGLKILFGGILMIIGIAKLTGADNAVVQLAKSAPGAALL